MTRKRTMRIQLAVELSKTQVDALAARVGVRSPPEEAVVRGMLHGLLGADLLSIEADYLEFQKHLAKRADERGREVAKEGAIRRPLPPPEVPDGPNNGS